MSFLIIGGERYALQLGETTLGGAGDDLFVASPLASLPPFAVLDSKLDEAATLRAVPGGPPVRIGDHPLDGVAATLHHGDRFAVAGLTILYGDMRALGPTAPVRGITPDEESLLDELSRADPTAPTGGVLIARLDGARHAIPDGGLTIGRDLECGLVVHSKAASRRHATISPGLLGYTISDESTNGLLVNGKRIAAPTLLRQGDIVRVGDVELRFEADAAEFEPERSLQPAEPFPATAPGTIMAGAVRAAPLLATLEILTRGADEGRRFRIERPVAQLGRGPRNDVQLADESISASHATLVRRGGAWHLLDLGSRNGSYVDGQRITEQTLDTVCELRLGNVKLVFRAIASAEGAEQQATRGIVGVNDAQLGGGRKR